MVKKTQIHKLMEALLTEMEDAGYDMKTDTLTREVMLPEYPGIRMTIHLGSVFHDMPFIDEEEMH